jgi:hypothetical protein
MESPVQAAITSTQIIGGRYSISTSPSGIFDVLDLGLLVTFGDMKLADAEGFPDSFLEEGTRTEACTIC